MIPFISLLMAAAPVPPESPPAPATAFLAAVAAGDLSAARATLSDEVQIMDAGHSGESSLEAFAASVAGCERTELTWEIDDQEPERSAVSVAWACPSREGAQAFIWTAGTRIVFIQFGLPPPQ